CSVVLGAIGRDSNVPSVDAKRARVWACEYDVAPSRLVLGIACATAFHGRAIRFTYVSSSHDVRSVFRVVGRSFAEGRAAPSPLVLPVRGRERDGVPPPRAEAAGRRGNM